MLVRRPQQREAGVVADGGEGHRGEQSGLAAAGQQVAQRDDVVEADAAGEGGADDVEAVAVLAEPRHLLGEQRAHAHDGDRLHHVQRVPDLVNGGSVDIVVNRMSIPTFVAASVAVVGVLAAVPAASQHRRLADLSSAHVTRTGPDTLEIALPLGGSVQPPCNTLSADVTATVDGAPRSLRRGGAGWAWSVSPGFPVPLPERRCQPAVLRVEDVGDHVDVALDDGVTRWRLGVDVPPMPACRLRAPADGRIAAGDTVSLRCAHDDVARLKPELFLVVGPDPRGTRPPLTFDGSDLSFVVPVDWPVQTERSTALRVRFPNTVPVVDATGPARVDVGHDDSFYLQKKRDVPVRVVVR